MSLKFILNLERGQFMNGVIIVNKSKGYTSHDIVAKVKKITGEKVGHTGTLDPLATGVLPILIGKGTLCSKYLMNHDKTYKVLLKLGIKKSTGATNKNVNSSGSVIPQRRATIAAGNSKEPTFLRFSFLAVK